MAKVEERIARQLEQSLEKAIETDADTTVLTEFEFSFTYETKELVDTEGLRDVLVPRVNLNFKKEKK